jgi:C1A family cysteine protease
MVSKVRDSGAEGSCVGFAVAAALECEIRGVSGREVTISPRYIYYYARKKGGFSTDCDTGAHLRDAVDLLLHGGAVAEEAWPYEPGEFAAEPPQGLHRARHYRIREARPIRSIEELKVALWEFIPVVGGICLFQSFYNEQVFRSGLIPMPDPEERVRGAAAVCFVGFDERPGLLKFRTPWGPCWGDHGYGYIPYRYAERYLSDAWAIRL